MAIPGGAGRLRHRVRIQRLSETLDGDGAPVKTHVDIDERWASIEPIGTDQRIEAHNVKGFTTHNIRLRYFEDVTSADRVVYGSRVFNIEGHWHVFEGKNETVLVCVEEGV